MADILKNVFGQFVQRFRDMGDGTHAEVVAVAANIADSDDVALGATTDAAVDSDTTGTVSGKLRGLVKILASVWDSVNGWLKVTIGSVQLDDTDKLAVSLYGKNSAAGDTPLITTQGFLGVAGQDGASTTRKFGGYTNNSDGQGATGGILGARAIVLFNDTTWDRQRNNVEATLLASAARTATTSSADQTNYNHRGVIITLAVTAVTDTPSITLAVEHKDSVGSNYEKLLDAVAVTATGVHTYIVYPGVGTAADDVVEASGYPLGRTWRVTVTHADADSITYSVAASLVL